MSSPDTGISVPFTRGTLQPSRSQGTIVHGFDLIKRTIITPYTLCPRGSSAYVI